MAGVGQRSISGSRSLDSSAGSGGDGERHVDAARVDSSKQEKEIEVMFRKCSHELCCVTRCVYLRVFYFIIYFNNVQ